MGHAADVGVHINASRLTGPPSVVNSSHWPGRPLPSKLIRLAHAAALTMDKHVRFEISSRALTISFAIDRPSQFMRQHGQGLALAMFFLQVRIVFWPGHSPLGTGPRLSEKAHFRCTLPILFPDVPYRFPPDSLAHFTTRQ